jgi:2'-5' RNA ligase
MLSESFTNRLKSLAGLNFVISEGKNHKNEYGCLMLKINYEGWEDILKKIDKKDLYTEEEGFGLERDPHVTILFGFHANTDIEEVKHQIKKHCKTPIKIELKNITMFENVEEKYDVLKFDIISPKLHELNKLMKDNFDYTNNFLDYHPHCTIAYLKAGTGKKYTSKQDKKEFTVNKFYYSTKDKEKTYFEI